MPCKRVLDKERVFCNKTKSKSLKALIDLDLVHVALAVLVVYDMVVVSITHKAKLLLIATALHPIINISGEPLHCGSVDPVSSLSAFTCLYHCVLPLTQKIITCVLFTTNYDLP